MSMLATLILFYPVTILMGTDLKLLSLPRQLIGPCDKAKKAAIVSYYK